MFTLLNSYYIQLFIGGESVIFCIQMHIVLDVISDTLSDVLVETTKAYNFVTSFCSTEC